MENAVITIQNNWISYRVYPNSLMRSIYVTFYLPKFIIQKFNIAKGAKRKKQVIFKMIPSFLEIPLLAYEPKITPKIGLTIIKMRVMLK